MSLYVSASNDHHKLFKDIKANNNNNNNNNKSKAIPITGRGGL
jgi:hypothetical protein